MKKGNPFQVEPLPKAFYYPSKEKELTKKEKKVCLSVPIPQQHQVTSPEDLKFLKDTNALKVQEIPTRENGSFGEQSSSSQFNESWPSTEQNGSHSTMVSDITSPEMSQQMKEWLSGKPDRPVSKSTLGWYISRFRNAPPTSRQIRDKSSFTNQKQGDFWWLSPPSGKSTPVLDTPPQRLKPSPSMGHVKETCKLPASTSSSPSLHTSDQFTEDLNKRAKQLLERSETSIESTSTEPFPLPLKKPVLTKTRTPETIPKHTSTPDSSTKLTTPTPNQAIQSTHKNPWPEDDILYQWRLARKMEKAQERATTGRSVGPWGLSYGTQRLLNSHNHIGSSPISGSTGLHLPKHSELFTLPEAPVVNETVFDPHTPVCASSTNIVSPMISNSASVLTTASTATQPNISSFVSPPCRHKSKSDNHGEVPPHMHLACDILPCSCSETKEKADLKICTAKLPNQKSAPINENHIDHSNPDSEMKNRKPLVDRSSCSPQDIAGSNLDSKDLTKQQTVEEPVVITRKTSDEYKEKKEDRVDKRDFERERNHLESPVQSNKKQLKSNISLEENEKTVTSNMKRQNKKKQEAFDVVDNVIGKVVSEHLFSGDLSSGENESCSSESILQQEREDEKHYIEPPEQAKPQECLLRESSEEEFTDDEILKMLRQRSKDLKTQLREIDQLILDKK